MPTTRAGASPRHRRAGAVAALLCLPLAACGTAASASGPAPPAVAATTGVPDASPGSPARISGTALPDLYRAPTPLPQAPAGTIIRSQALPTDRSLPAGTRAWRVLYHSTTDGGSDVAVSGLVVAPPGPPPPGGFPVVSWAHGTTGVATGCAPSLDGTASLPDLRAYLRAGLVVAATDYQGLGGPGLHPYLDGLSEAQDVLDAARAARSLLGAAVSNGVVVAGYSQGGQAALFAGQIAQEYAPELWVAGVVAVAPVTSLLELAPVGDRPPAGGQGAFTAMGLYSWARTSHAFSLGDALTAEGMAEVPVVATGCTGAVAAVFDAAPPDRYFRTGWEELPGVRAADAASTPGNAPTSAPVLLIQGTRDTLVPAGTTARFVANRLCRAQYDTVQYEAVAGADHTSVLAAASATVPSWAAARLAGRTPVDTCSRRGS